MRRLWRSYEACLHARPVTTKATVSFTMFTITDVAVQRLERSIASRDIDDGESRAPRQFNVDVPRTATQAMFGAYYGIVHAHFIWGKLEQLFGAVRRAGVVIPGGRLGGAMARVAVDQFITGTPLFNTVFFYSTGRFSRGMNHDDALQHVRARLGPMLQLHWSFWVPFHTINFWLVPFRHRLLPAQAALFGWSSFMSYTGARK